MEMIGMRKVFLDDLPKKCGGINWSNSIGCKVKFIYDDIDGEIQILDYDKEKQKIKVLYKNNEHVFAAHYLLKCHLKKMIFFNINKRYVKGTNIEDVTGMKFGRLTAIKFDSGRYEKDKIRRESGDIKNYSYCWICKCDCGAIISTDIGRLKNGMTKSCGCYNLEETRRRNSKVRSKSFEDWCLDNNHQDYLDLWDYELNDKKPSEIAYSSNKKYWFKCKYHSEHKSSVFKIASLTHIKDNGNMDTIVSCKECDSLGFYLNEYCKNDIEFIKTLKGETDPYKIYKKSQRKAIFKHNACGQCFSVNISNFVKGGYRCRICSDGISFPNKFVTAILVSLNIEFESEKLFGWSNNKRYDHYIPSLNMIIENHGMQHYNGGFDSIGGNTLEDEISNDILKKEIAIMNGIEHYIVLDCRKSELEWIKNSIMNSELPNLLNFKEEDIDWDKCAEFSFGSLQVKAWELWNSKKFSNTKLLSDELKVNRSTIIKWLKNGSDIGKCVYEPKKEMIKNGIKNGKKRKSTKQIKVIKNDVVVATYKSASELADLSEAHFGVKISTGQCYKICRGILKSPINGYTFKYIDENNVQDI